MPVFGPSARKIWWALHEAGLITRLFHDPMEAEETVFGAGQCIGGNRCWSIMTFTWFSGIVLKNGSPLWLGNWDRIEKISAALKVSKVVYLGKKLASEGGRDWTKSAMKPANPFGYLRANEPYGNPVRHYGLPMKNIGSESLPYFAELK